MPTLLQNFQYLFDGTIGTWKTGPVDFELKEYKKPVCSWPYLVTKVHEEMFKKEVECLVILGVLDLEHNSEWRAPSFAQPKPKSNQVRF